MYTIENIIEKAKKVHGEKYDYSKAIYKKLVLPIEIICPKHGSFWQAPHEHLKGQGCPKCGIESRSLKKTSNTDEFIKKAKEIHGGKYDYSKVEYKKSNEKVCIICPKHGEFFTKPNWHLNGQGCPKCGKELRDKNESLTTEEFIERSRKVHGDKYDYSKIEYKNSKTKVCIICPKHGEFWQAPCEHMKGQGCKKCSQEKNTLIHTKSTEQFIEDARKVHGDKYSYENCIYKGCYKYVTITCPTHGNFKQIASYHLCGNGCQKCGGISSKPEEDVYNFIKSVLPDKTKINLRERKVLPGKELDIYVPEKKIAIEFDGLYWHCEINKEDKNYHLNKTNECEEKGIELIQIFEDEWMHKKEICKSRIKSALGIIDKKIPARKCIISEIDNKTAKIFIENNHLQGYFGGKINYGLFYENELVSVMTFSALRKNLGSRNEENVYELLRFCNKINTTVVGGASKLFKHFIKEVQPKKVISYCDRRWGNGNMYEQLGFKLDHLSQPNYFYVIGRERKNRFCYRKDILVSKYGCPKEMTEHEFCLQNHWYRIYDCGTKVFYYE